MYEVFSRKWLTYGIVVEGKVVLVNNVVILIIFFFFENLKVIFNFFFFFLYISYESMTINSSNIVQLYIFKIIQDQE